MNQYDTADHQVIQVQFIRFMLAGVIGLLGDSLLNRPAIAVKFAEAIFITGCIPATMKLARKGWNLPAAWSGVVFLLTIPARRKASCQNE